MPRKNPSAIISGAGWLASFADKLIKALRERGVSDEEIHSLVTDGGVLPIGKIADVLAEIIRQTKNIFRLAVRDNRTTEEMVNAGKYNWFHSDITNRNFPPRPRFVKKVIIELIDFDRDITSEEAIKEAQKRGLKQPTFEDALLFGEQYPQEQRKHKIVFLHDPWWSDSLSSHVVLVLDVNSNSTERNLYLLQFKSRWPHRTIFAFVRK